MAKNLCHDCNSTYRKPGTCNCFAPGGKRDPNGGDAGGVVAWAWYLCSNCGGLHQNGTACPNGTVTISYVAATA